MKAILKHIRPCLLAFSAVLALASCSVKEDRRPCPGYLYVSFAGKEAIDETVGLLGWAQTERFRDTVNVSEVEDYWMRAVRHEVFELTSYRGAETAKPENHVIILPEGHQCDSLYAWHEEVDCTQGDAYAEVVFRKQFCTVYIDFVSSSVDRMQDMKVLVEGNTCGFDLLDFSPVAGPFSFAPVSADGTVWSLRIPRQADESLRLSVWSRPDSSSEWAGPKEFPVGEYIVKTGYDWAAEELEDVFIKVDFVLGFVTVGIADWEDGGNIYVIR